MAVYFDTNSLHAKGSVYESLTSPNLLALREIASSSGLPLCIPEVVADELLDRLARRFREALQELRERAEFIADALNRAPLAVETVSLEENLSRLRKTYRERLVAQGFEIVATPRLPFDRLLAEAINKVPPFEHADRGFRDAVILETVASDASRRAPGGYVLIVSNENWSPEVLERLRAQGVDGDVVKVSEVATRLTALLEQSTIERMAQRDSVAKEFLGRHKNLIEEAIKKARVPLEPVFGPRVDDDDPLRHGELRHVTGYRMGEILSTYPGLGDDEELARQGRYPIFFSVAVYLDVVLAEPTLAGLWHGPVVSLENVTHVRRLEHDFASEPRTVLTNRTLKRSVGIEATVARDGAESGSYHDLRIMRVS